MHSQKAKTHICRKHAEFVDIIDPKTDSIIGKTTYEDVHKRNLWHRGTGIFVFGEKGDLLIQRRSLNKRVLPGYFETTVEHVRAGETYLDAALRGLSEELSMKPKGLTHLFKVLFDYPKLSERGFVYQFGHRDLSINASNIDRILIDLSEIAGLELMSLNKVIGLINERKLDVTPLFELQLQKYLKYSKAGLIPDLTA